MSHRSDASTPDAARPFLFRGTTAHRLGYGGGVAIAFLSVLLVVSTGPLTSTPILPAPRIAGHALSGGTNSTWHQILPWNSPNLRTSAQMAYFPKLGGDLLFGGYNPAIAADGDTWLFHNSTWTDLTSNLTNSPAARWEGGMVYDAHDGYLLLFGGRSPGTFYNDTWGFNGTSWSPINTTSAPSPRGLFGMTYDANLQSVVLFGGGIGNVAGHTSWTTYNDTWTFQAGQWVNVTSNLTGAPPTTSGAAFAYDPTLGGELLAQGSSIPGGVQGTCTTTTGTWELANSTWTQLAPLAQTPARSVVGGAYDTHLSRVVSFGGLQVVGSNCTDTADTWEYTSAWSNATSISGHSPSPRHAVTVTYDPSIGGLLLFGGSGPAGYGSDTWEFNPYNASAPGNFSSHGLPGNPTWKPVNWNGSAPGIRTSGQMDYSPGLQGDLLFGGYNPAVAAYGDTWLFRNGSWTNLTASVGPAPPARWEGGMVYDRTDGYLLLFGGRSVGAFYNDTWSFNGTGWTHIATATAPSPRGLFGMAYDPGLGDVVLFGGGIGNVVGHPSWTPYNDTWTYRAGHWANITLSATGAPPPTIQGFLTFDPIVGGDVFAGGTSVPGGAQGTCAVTTGTWTFSGLTWKSVLPPVNATPGRTGWVGLYDPNENATVAYGGIDGTNPSCNDVNGTWTFTRQTWYTVANLTQDPGPRRVATASYDPLLQGIVLLGGNDNGLYLNDTWVFSATSVPSGHGGGGNSTRGHPGAIGVTWTATSGVAPFLVTFSATPPAGWVGVQFSWSFGDGGSATGPLVSHTYLHGGTFQPSVTARASNGTTLVALLPLMHVVTGPSGGPATTGLSAPSPVGFALIVVATAVVALAAAGLLHARSKARLRAETEEFLHDPEPGAERPSSPPPPR